MLLQQSMRERNEYDGEYEYYYEDVAAKDQEYEYYDEEITIG